MSLRTKNSPHYYHTSPVVVTQRIRLYGILRYWTKHHLSANMPLLGKRCKLGRFAKRWVLTVPQYSSKKYMASLIKDSKNAIVTTFWFRNLSSNTGSSSVVTSPSYFVVSLRRLRRRRGQSPFPVYFVSLCLCRAIRTAQYPDCAPLLQPSLVHLGIFTFAAAMMIPQIT